MGESNGSVYVDIERISFGGKDHHVLTRHGPISVAVYGDLEKPALVTYPDVALHYIPCFQGLFFCPEASALLLHNFCIYHINPPGHEFDAAPICSHDSVLSVDQLADQVADVLDFFELGSVLCLGVTAGACMLSLFATRYRERVLGLVLVSPLCKAPSWTEWFYNKDIRGSSHIPESDIVQACRSDTSFCRREFSIPFRGPDMMTKLDRRYSALVEVQSCGSFVTEEQPRAMLVPLVSRPGLRVLRPIFVLRQNP